MTHYDRIDLIGDNMMLVDVDCETCDDGGPTDDCTCCAGMDVAFYDLTTLLRNIAVAGGLALAWKLGNRNGAEWYAGIAVRKDGP